MHYLYLMKKLLLISAFCILPTSSFCEEQKSPQLPLMQMPLRVTFTDDDKRAILGALCTKDEYDKSLGQFGLECGCIIRLEVAAAGLEANRSEFAEMTPEMATALSAGVFELSQPRTYSAVHAFIRGQCNGTANYFGQIIAEFPEASEHYKKTVEVARKEAAQKVISALAAERAKIQAEPQEPLQAENDNK